MKMGVVRSKIDQQNMIVVHVFESNENSPESWTPDNVDSQVGSRIEYNPLKTTPYYINRLQSIKHGYLTLLHNWPT